MQSSPHSPHPLAERRAESPRASLARELHDGLLQVLTGTSLEIEAIFKLWDRDPDEARARLRNVADAISDEQRELRFLVDEYRAVGDLRVAAATLKERVAATLDRISSVWGVSIDARLELGDVDAAPFRTSLRVLQEAISNAVRHGGASHVVVRMQLEGDEVHLDIEDDGVGFPFEGRLTHEELVSERSGPISLKNRVCAADGRLEIESTPTGAKVHVRLPVQDSNT